LGHGQVFVWGVASGKCLTSFDDHHNYVQGVCWDPREKVTPHILILEMNW
jgi:hypothetical protein